MGGVGGMGIRDQVARTDAAALDAYSSAVVGVVDGSPRRSPTCA